jgi:hypothetical protein
VDINTSSQIIKYEKKDDQLHESVEKKPKEQQKIETIKSTIETIKSQNDKKSDEYDDIDYFFKSLSLSTKKLPTKGISEAKLKMLSAFIEIEDKYMTYPPTSAGVTRNSHDTHDGQSSV